MASMKKFTNRAVAGQLKHCKREIENNRNTDIDPARSPQNIILSPDRGMPEYEYYRQRKSELYCYNRADLKTLVGWIITAPQELKSREEQISFFRKTYEFLEKRYGRENLVLAICHFDEGKTRKIKERWGEDYVMDENGDIQTEVVLGRPHLHFYFIPAVPDRNPKHPQAEKICASERVNKKDLLTFHPDLSKYTGCDGVINHKIKELGRNFTVKELKANYEDIENELERLREIECKYNRTIEWEIDRTDNGARW